MSTTHSPVGAMTRPLDGVTVVSLEHAIAAPFASRQLADLGARVIKVERPGQGDFARAYDQRVHGQASHFVWVNRSKESLALDLKLPAALQVLRDLVGRADVLLQNLAPGAAARMGLDYTSLSADHPRLVVCDLGLRQRRPLPRQEGLRPADPERGGLPVGDGHAAGAVQGRQLDRRHRRRHVCLLRHPGGAAAAPADRPRLAHRRGDAGSAGRVDGLSDVLRLRGRAAAGALGGRARDDLSLRPVRGRRRPHRDARAAERARVEGVLRQGAAAAGAGGRPAL